MKVLLINDSTSNPNWGDRAAAVSLKELITAAGGEIVAAISERSLVLSSFGRDLARHDEGDDGRTRDVLRLLVPPVFPKLRHRLSKDPYATPGGRLVPRKWESFADGAAAVRQNDDWRLLLEAIAEVDVVVIHGDGAMVGSGIIPRTDLFVAYLAKTHVGTPTVIVNHTADFDDPDLLRMAQGVYPLFDDVVFRDPISVERCKGFCEGRFAADSAFWFEPLSRESWVPVSRRLTYFDVWPDAAHWDPSEPYLCIGGSSKSGFDERPYPIRRGYASLIRHLQSRYGGQIVLTASDPTDQETFRPIAKELGLPLVGLTTPVQQAVDILGNADAYVGGRWHPGIFALRGGTPIVPIGSKTFKMQALARMAGLPDTTFDVVDLEGAKEEICSQVQVFLEMGAEGRSTIIRRAEELSGSIWENVAYLRERRVRDADIGTD